MKPTPLVRETIQEWQKQLLQLDRRNNLLYFNDSRSSVPLVETQPDDFVVELTTARSGLSFAWAERRRGGAAPLSDDVYETPGDITSNCPTVELQRRLKNLRGKDREWLEEQGVNVLFLAVGFLRWVDVDGEPAKAPILLVPCDLFQASPRDPFMLQRESDEIVLNATLRHVLSQQGIELPEYTDDQPVSEFLALVDETIKARDGWSVSPELVLGTFQFSKLAMWEDLESLRAEEEVEPLVCALAGDASAANAMDRGGGGVHTRDHSSLEGGAIDDELDPRDQWLVLPADFSQVLAVARARSGEHLVIHGPPGTGKSQTIANIIGALMAEGRSVLFVSEKTAALDVVKRRLEASGLGIFCLDLHSERGRKANVYAQLKESRDDARTGSKKVLDYDLLVEKRRKLNQLTRTLHERREPLGRSVYEVHGQFAAYRDFPDVEMAVPTPGGLTQAEVRRFRGLATSLAERSVEFREHLTSLWLPLRPNASRVVLADALRKDAATVTAAAQFLRAAGIVATQRLGVPKSTTRTDLAALASVFAQLAATPGGVPQRWLVAAVTPRLQALAEAESAHQAERHRLMLVTAPSLGPQLPPLEYADLGSALRSALREPALPELLGTDWRARVVREAATLPSNIATLHTLYPQLTDALIALARALQEPTPTTRRDANELLSFAAEVLSLAPVPPAWVAGNVSAADVDSAESALLQLETAESAFTAKYEVELIGLVDQAMLVRYRTDHRSLLARFRKQFKDDQRTLQGAKLTQGRISVDQATSAIAAALEIRDQRIRWEARSNELSALLGNRFAGRGTNWDKVRRDHLGTTRMLIGKASTRETIGASLLADGSMLRPVANAAAELLAQVIAVESQLLPANPSLGQPLDAVSILARACDASVRVVADVVTQLSPELLSPVTGAEQLGVLLDSAAWLARNEADQALRAAALAADFGERFVGLPTVWADIQAAIDWTANFLRLVGAKPSATAIAHAVNPRSTNEYSHWKTEAQNACATFDREMALLNDRLDESLTPWGSWSLAPDTVLKHWARQLSETADSASAWLNYLDHVQELEQFGGAGLVSRIRKLTAIATDIPPIVERKLLSQWLEAVYDAEPALKAFASPDQNLLIQQFRDLDKSTWKAAQAEIRRRCFKKYPDRHATSAQAGEVGALNKELSKKRNLMPVRLLFKRAPNLIAALKPCFLMSPLAVSQYLPRSPLASETLTFDTVVFDEASQIFPEDAMPAIARARQVIVVGDSQQLPPSSFFKKGMDEQEEEWNDDNVPSDANALKGRDSILEAFEGMRGLGVGGSRLLVHYRSRHEDLIRFSNHHFYDDRLLVFPSPHPATPGLGVRDVLLQEGRYDAGASRTNRVEADRVVDLVFELMRTRPSDESIGVVALSRNQASLVERLIDDRRLLERDVDHRFSPTVEPFFVKNLENVQGDERDHIILTIGYGPVGDGKHTPNRFGPINTEGGGRRLNVAVSRARRSMTVVRSLRASDIVSEQVGSQLLKRYIEFAENPRTAIAANQVVDPDAEPESPFEEAVLRALNALGYDVVPQVGVAGYRIDLAVRSEDGSRFDLAIECDGFTYHSSPAARDRDWLRQSILEDLGWTFHRVWSTAWARDPKAALAEIVAAIAAARLRPADSRIDVTDNPDPVEGRDGWTHDGGDADAAQPDKPSGTANLLFEPYVEADIIRMRRGENLGAETDSNLHPMLLKIAEVEGPVHFEVIMECLRGHYYQHRAGSVMRDRVSRALASLHSRGDIDLVVRDSPADAFVSLPGGEVVPRSPTDEGYRREIREISPAELQVGIKIVLRSLFGASRDDTIREITVQFGYARTGPDIRDAMEGAIDALLATGELVEQFESLSVRPDDRE